MYEPSLIKNHVLYMNLKIPISGKYSLNFNMGQMILKYPERGSF
jgi:hypothetical protein